MGPGACADRGNSARSAYMLYEKKKTIVIIVVTASDSVF